MLARLFGIWDDIAASKSRQTFKDLAARLMVDVPPDQFNQAIMEFGALHCTPKQPQCSECPFSGWCRANKENVQHLLPVKSKKVSAKKRYFYYYVIKSGPKLLLKKRAHKDIWQGLYDFLLVEHDIETDPMELLTGSIPNESLMDQMVVGEPSIEYRHKLTHQHINARFLEIEAIDETALNRWKQAFDLKVFSVSEVHELPKPILINNYLKAGIF